MIFARLREQTRTAHERVETSVNILESTRSLTAYRELLATFYGFYSPLESQLASLLTSALPDFDFEARRKRHLLRQDFDHLGITHNQIAAFPLCRNLPALEAVPQGLGCLYVLEGATLGGKIISRHLQETLHLDAANGAAFFNSYGSQTGKMWREFGAMLTRYAQTHTEDEKILQGAVDTFAAFEVWFA